MRAFLLALGVLLAIWTSWELQMDIRDARFMATTMDYAWVPARDAFWQAFTEDWIAWKVGIPAIGLTLASLIGWH